MRVSSARARSVCAFLVATAVAITCPVPCFAAPAPSLTNLSATSRALLQRSDPPTRTQTPPGGSSSFFRSGKGVAVLVLLGAGFGYALYSKVHDEIKSPVREQ